MSKQEEELQVFSLEEFADDTAEKMLATGYTPEFVEMFICLRFHITHPWGTGHAMFGDKKVPVIVRLNEEGKIKVCFVAFDPSMKLLDIYGVPLTEDGLAVENARSLN